MYTAICNKLYGRVYLIDDRRSTATHHGGVEGRDAPPLPVGETGATVLGRIRKGSFGPVGPMSAAEKLEEIRPELERLAESDLPIADLAELALEEVAD